MCKHITVPNSIVNRVAQSAPIATAVAVGAELLHYHILVIGKDLCRAATWVGAVAVTSVAIIVGAAATVTATRGYGSFATTGHF